MFEKLFGFLHKKEHAYNYLVDIHSHLIPGIDDGAKTMYDAILLISKLKK